jgi:hypothetical protein
MPSRRDPEELAAWLTTQVIDMLKQTMHAYGIDPKVVPYGWRPMQALEDQVRQHADALAGDFTTALQAIEASRRQYGPRHGTLTQASV